MGSNISHSVLDGDICQSISRSVLNGDIFIWKPIMACSEGIEKFPVAPWPEARNPSKSGPHFLLTFETHRNASRSAPDFVLTILLPEIGLWMIPWLHCKPPTTVSAPHGLFQAMVLATGPLLCILLAKLTLSTCRTIHSDTFHIRICTFACERWPAFLDHHS